MDYIKVLTDLDFGLNIKEFINPRIRYGARGIVFNDNNEIAILYKKNINEYKIIGGGIIEDEEIITAFKREVLEETGCKIEVDSYLGNIKEEKSQANFIQTSYIYTAHVIEDTKKLNLTQEEIDEGSELLWLKLDDAINIIKNCEDKLNLSKSEDIYHNKFIVRRDYIILTYYKNLLEKNS